MRILFIENRHKTYFYEPIAHALREKDYEIHWLIQNKEFLPSKDFTSHLIPYPQSKIEFTRDEEIESLIRIDRQFNHFEKKDSSYFYYYNQKIAELLDIIQPDIVFGESTAFHELITIVQCKRKDILFLNPSTCRYPVGRFSFYLNDTLMPYQGSNEKLDTKESLEVIRQIIHRTSVPDYMKLVPPSKITKIQDKMVKMKSYALGEKFNTPDPRVKYKLEKQKKRIITSWDAIAEMHIEEVTEFSVLYPLQMQPEANIDVWGKNHRDQTQLIEQLSNNLPTGVKLIVKPNPKSKYEISEELIQLVHQRDNIVPLHHKVKMDDVLPKVDLVITVTGTIAIECILSDVPVVTLVHTINNQIKSCIYINNIESELNPLIEKIIKGEFPRTTEADKIGFINLLNQSSYKGKISDPFTDVSCVSDENIKSLVIAFESVLTKHGKH